MGSPNRKNSSRSGSKQAARPRRQKKSIDRMEFLTGTAQLSMFELTPTERLAVIKTALAAIKPQLKFMSGAMNTLEEIRPIPQVEQRGARYEEPLTAYTKAFELASIGKDRDDRIESSGVRHMTRKRLLLTDKSQLVLCVADREYWYLDEQQRSSTTFTVMSEDDLAILMGRERGAYIVKGVVQSLYHALHSVICKREEYLSSMRGAYSEVYAIENRIAG